MHLPTIIILLALLIPAALAGIGGALIDVVANIQCLSTALPHANALLTEIAPLVPAAGLLLAGVATLGISAWSIVRIVESR